jgi:hypothetical protein
MQKGPSIKIPSDNVARCTMESSPAAPCLASFIAWSFFWAAGSALVLASVLWMEAQASAIL